MKTIYLDSNYKCHVINDGTMPADDGTMTALETDIFDGKCDTFIEGYRYIPAGESWIREDGTVFTGKMVAPCVDYVALAAAQAQYEADQAELETAYQEGVNSV